MQSESDFPPHPAGIVLRRHGYFTLPALEEMIPVADGRCLVENFVVAREGYGNVLFPGLTNVAGMNLDEIGEFVSTVTFKHCVMLVMACRCNITYVCFDSLA